MNNKTISILIVIGFLVISINQSAANPEYLGGSSSLFYGFILPNVTFENKSLENKVFCKIRHLVNDLLREDIPIYWITTNTTANITDISLVTQKRYILEKDHLSPLSLETIHRIKNF